jgi:Peptidase inhibitor I78 family
MRTLLALCLLPLGGCMIAQSKTVEEMEAGPCRNESLARFTGEPATQELGARMLAASGGRVIRWVPKGAAMTMDYRADRVTAYLDSANRIERASCG